MAVTGRASEHVQPKDSMVDDMNMLVWRTRWTRIWVHVMGALTHCLEGVRGRIGEGWLGPRGNDAGLPRPQVAHIEGG
jgi:hypothetical protein